MASSEEEPPLEKEVADAVAEETKAETKIADEQPPEGTTTETEVPAPSTPPPSLQTTEFEDDGTFALPPGQSYETTTPTVGQGAPNAANSKGAQIIMNRFSNWRQKANENANILWKQAKEAQAQAVANNQGPLAALRQVSGVTVGSGMSPTKNDAGEAEGKGSTEEDGADEEKDSTEEKEEGFMVYGDEDKPEEAPSSARSLPNLPTRKELRTKAQFVATGLVESLDTYATGFRGRYANSGPDLPKPSGQPTSPHTAAKESQTALILKSRAASHLQDILDSLEPYQYVLLLGAGRLQVNLKNPYVKHQGTYVDYLVQGGAADKSGVVAVGDSIVKVGPQDVRKHTIADVPSIIAQAKRPVVLVLTTGIELEVERITYLDLAVAMMHQLRAKDEQQKREMIASARKNKKPESEENASEHPPEEATSETSKEQTMDDAPKEEEPQKGPSFEDVRIPSISTVEDYSSPPQPPMTARLAYKHLVGKR